MHKRLSKSNEATADMMTGHLCFVIMIYTLYTLPKNERDISRIYLVAATVKIKFKNNLYGLGLNEEQHIPPKNAVNFQVVIYSPKKP